jgi:transposase
MNSYVGIDVSKDELVVHVLPGEQARGFPNTASGLAGLVGWLMELDCQRIAFEASGGYERDLLDRLHQAGLPAVRLPARRPRDLAKALGLKAKTDALDAPQLLPAATTPPLTAAMQDLREWLQLRTALVGERDNHRRRIQQVRQASVQAYLRTLIDSLQQRIAEVEQQLRRTLEHCPLQITAAPGLGPILRATLVARLPELGQLDRRQVAALVGLAPYNRDSGRWRGRRCIGGGRADVRRVLYMATWAAIRARTPLAQSYQRMVAAGKPKKLALTACMRKYLTMLNAMARDQAPWTPAAPTG